MTTYATDQLRQLLGQKQACLAELCRLGRTQWALIEADDIGRLLEVLAAKQTVIGRLHEVERLLDPFRGQDPQQRHWPSDDHRRQCAELLQQNELLFQEILRQERDSEEHLRRRRDQAAQRLQGVYNAGQARGAYAGAATDPVGGLDLSCES